MSVGTYWLRMESVYPTVPGAPTLACDNVFDGVIIAIIQELGKELKKVDVRRVVKGVHTLFGGNIPLVLQSIVREDSFVVKGFKGNISLKSARTFGTYPQVKAASYLKQTFPMAASIALIKLSIIIVHA